MIREADRNDISGLLELYLYLHEVSVPELDDRMLSTWNRILDNEDYHIIVCEEDGMIVSSCTCIVVPNLTRNGSPYALVENVVTHEKYRGRGLASACLKKAEEIAVREGCYKIMLITGSDNPDTHAFYKKAGFSSEGKTAYYHRLKDVNWKKI